MMKAIVYKNQILALKKLVYLHLVWHYLLVHLIQEVTAIVFI